ncbi:MAG: winged helix-turn-helix domain-containing protein [Caldilineaceae bacterium]|nr:winged helix-turn-helix domain-containing protein [Caldilineaceae bacterium]
MDPAYSVKFFGPFQFLRAETPLPHFATERGQALLAYLLLNADRVHTRAALAELLWPEQGQKQSRQNLRQTLSRMRRDLVGAALDDPLQGDYRILRLDGSRFDVDVLRFERLLAESRSHPHRAVEECPHCADLLRQAIALYRGELLAGLNVDDSPAFEEWLLLQREICHRQAVDALQTLIVYHHDLRDHAVVRDLARQLIGLEPYQESAHAYAIEALALLGEREAALTQYERCVTMLAEELGVAPGERLSQLHSQLIQFDKPAQLVAEMARTLPQPGQRHHFPQSLVPLFGRRKEVGQIVARLSDPNCRLLTVVGPGGMGKSRLVIEATHHLNPLTFADGLYFVPLAAIADAEGMVRAIADAVSIPLAEGEALPQLLRRLASLRLLLVLDNFEHLVDAAPLVLDVLKKAPGVACLITSRHPLQLEAEWLLPLPGLDYPSVWDDPHFESYSAVAFFLDRARRMRPDFVPSPADRRAILAICHLVDGIPLAISMAAAWLSVHECGAIATEIRKSLDFFAIPLRDLPPRHQSLRAAFEVSWQLLSPSARQTLARLAIFHGSFSHEAAQQVTSASPFDLARLVTHSLVTRVDANHYTLHELVCQFAAEKLAELAQTQATRRAHYRYYLARLGAEETEMVGADQLPAIERLRGDLPNLRAAWLSASAEGDWAILQQSMKAFERFWLATGRQIEGESLMAAAAVHLTADLDQRGDGEDEPAFSLEGRRELLARVKLAQGLFAHAYAPLQEAIDAVQSALSVAQSSALISSDLLGEIHLTLSWLYHHQGRRTQVAVHLSEAQRRLHHCPDAALRSRLHLELSAGAGQKGDQVGRRAHLERAVALAEESGDLSVDFIARRYLAHMQIRWGDFSTVSHHIERLLHNARQVKNLQMEAQALSLYGGYYFYMGDFERMAAYNRQAAPLLKKTGGAQYLAIFQMRQALYALMVGDLDRVIEVTTQALQFSRDHHHHDLEAIASVIMGRAQTQIGALEAAWTSFEHAIHIFDTHGRSLEHITAVLGQASILLAQGRAEAGRARIEPYLPTILKDHLGIVVDYGHVYADTWRILCGCGDPCARDLLTRGHVVLTRVAETIPTDDLRHTFWHNNPSHRLILAQRYT